MLEANVRSVKRDCVVNRTHPPLSTLALPCFDGVYLPKQENEFVHNVLDDLAAYQQKHNRKSVLLFPSLPSRLRYLIHKTTENLPELATFSVGESWCRRVVVCYSELRGEVEEDSDLESNNSLCEELPKPRSRRVAERVSKPKSSTSLRNRGPKRPDKPLYMPRAARERLSFQNVPAPIKGPESLSPGSCSCSCIISTCSDSCSCSDTTENTMSSFTSDQESLHSAADSICDGGTNSSPRCPEDEKQDVITAHLKQAEIVSIEHAHNDYSCFKNVWICPDELGHVIEIYDFPSSFKTDDLLDVFTEYSDGGMKIKWVDNTHALGVFSSEPSALHALSIRHPQLKTRTLCEGSKKAKDKATRQAEFLQPVKERPRTDCAVARRMVTRALGLQRGGRGKRY
ncbi:R3H and coiled-coil domain-containing protein 1-like [Diretmus argenteus]